LHQWVALTKADKQNYEEIQGYLRVGVSVIGPGDQQVKLDVPTTETNTLILMPPTVSIEYHQLIFRFYDGQGLPDLDFGGGCDAYIQTKYLDFNANTKDIPSKKGSVTWNEEMWIAMRRPALGGKVSFGVYNKNILADDYIGSMDFSLKYIEQKVKKATRWINLYGATPNSGNKFYRRLYNENPDFASSWNGRILVQLEKLDSKNPQQKCIKATNMLDTEVTQLKKMKKYYVEVNIGEGICLPEKQANLSVEVRVAEYSFNTEEKKPLVAGRCYSWNWKTNPNTVIELPYELIKDIPDIFVYIKQGKSYISFKRVRARDCSDPQRDWEWLALDENLSDGRLSGKNNCGIISWKFRISDRPIEQKVEATGWKVKPTPKFYKIFVHIFQCKDLPAADEEGTSDTYINIVTSSEVPLRTSIAYATLNPVYFIVKLLDLVYNKGFTHSM